MNNESNFFELEGGGDTDFNEDEGLVYNIKHVLDHNTADDYIEELQLAEQAHDEQIKAVCYKKADELARNFSKFYAMKEQISSLEEKMGFFAAKIEICRKQNQYDKLEIKQKERLLLNIESTLKLLNNTKEMIELVTKAIYSLKLKKYQPCMRSILQLQKIQDSASDSEASIIPSFQALLSQILPMIITKIHIDLEGMIREWIKYSKDKQKEFGAQMFAQIESALKNQVYEDLRIQGGRQTNAGMGMRESLFFKRESVTNRVSINQLNRQSIMNSGAFGNDRQSMMMRSSQNRMSISQSKASLFESTSNYPQTAIPFSRADFSRTSRVSKINNMPQGKSLQKEWKTDSIIDFFQLKQPQSIYEMMKEKQIFNETFKQNRMGLLYQVCEAGELRNSKQFREFLENVVGFFIVEKEIEQGLKEASCLQAMWVEGMQHIEMKFKSYFCNLSDENEFIPSKNEIVLFSNILYKIGLESASLSLMKIIKDSLLQFTNRIIYNIKQSQTERIVDCSFVSINIQEQDDYDVFCRIFDCGATVNADSTANPFNQKLPPLPFTLIIQEFALLINKFIEDSVQFLKGVTEYDALIFSQLDVLFSELNRIMDTQVLFKAQTEIQIAQIFINLEYLKKSLKFYVKSIESQLNISPSHTFECVLLINQTKSKCEEEMIIMICQKVDDLISQYNKANWLPKEKNKTASSFIQEIVDYLMMTFQTLQIIQYDQIDKPTYISIKRINTAIWDYLVGPSCKAFNIIGLMNLRIDLLAITDMCHDHFKQFVNLTDCLKELDQLIFLFVDRNPMDFLEKKNRDTYFTHLDPAKLIPILEKYVKLELKNTRLPVPRKRECKEVAKKLREELGIKQK